MTFVIALDGVHRRKNVLGRAEREQAAARGQQVAERRVLIDDGTARREIAATTIAEPAAAREIAEEYFSAEKVLKSLCDRAGL